MGFGHPILAPDGTPMTRSFPMKKMDGEDTEHPWHCSLMFAHSSVNGVITPRKDYAYGYRQGIVRDPEGHAWLIQKKI